MTRSQAKKIYQNKRQGCGYKPSRLKRPPSARMVRKWRAKQIMSRSRRGE